MNKTPIAILGATGLVGQKIIELLTNHPFFEVKALMASEKSVGKRYKDFIQDTSKFPSDILEMKVSPCKPQSNIELAFSALDSKVAFDIEQEFLEFGINIISNAKNFRMQDNVPLIIPEINANHIDLIHTQKTPGKIITNPNCVVAGLALALKPLQDAFGLNKVNVSTMQGLSGAGKTALDKDHLNNIVPHIEDEEEKIESEPKKILGTLINNQIEPLDISLSAHCHRVPILHGHMMSISLSLKNKATKSDLIQAWETFNQNCQNLNLPSIPKKPIEIFNENHFPQHKHHLHNGMSISIGKLRECSCLDFKFVVLVHNLIRGAAGAALLNAELHYKCSSIIKN